MKFVLFYLLNVEKISTSFNSFLFNKSFQQKELLNKLSLPTVSLIDKIKNIKNYEYIFNDSEYKIELWKGLNLYDFEF